MNGRVDEVRGTFRKNEREAAKGVQRYEQAKKMFDMVAAMDIVEEVVQGAVLDLIIDSLIMTNMPALIAMPHPEYDAGAADNPAAPVPSNALPFALASHIAAELDAEIDEEIIEIARPGRSPLSLFPRFLWQPAFSGAVRPDRAYILVDDVCTVGGTLATLRSYIVEHGGTVIAVCTLAHGSGEHQAFPIAPATVGMLNSYYGPGVGNLWVQEVGHGIECLTEAEGQALAQWWRDKCANTTGPGASALRRLRSRLAEAAENHR